MKIGDIVQFYFRDKSKEMFLVIDENIAANDGSCMYFKTKSLTTDRNLYVPTNEDFILIPKKSLAYVLYV